MLISSYFFTLVGMQWGNLLATRTRRLSIFQHNPFSPSSPAKNWWIPPAMLASLAFLFFFSYVPFFQNTFLTRVSRTISFAGAANKALMTRVFRSNISSSPSLSPSASCFLMREGSISLGSTPRVSWQRWLGDWYCIWRRRYGYSSCASKVDLLI